MNKLFQFNYTLRENREIVDFQDLINLSNWLSNVATRTIQKMNFFEVLNNRFKGYFPFVHISF